MSKVQIDSTVTVHYTGRLEDGSVFDLKLSHYQDGPNRAIRNFLNNNSDRFEIDTQYCDYYGHNVTWNTNGYIKCIK
jgi:cephalosporin hydroxylase